jgi:hypothetical protein
MREYSSEEKKRRCRVNFSEQPPSKQWMVLKYKGEKIAEVWFKPEGEPLALAFRVPQKSFQNPDVAQLLTAENLLNAVAIATDEVESWRCGDVFCSSINGPPSEWKLPLPPPGQGVAQLMIYVRLKPPPQTGLPKESPESAIPLAKWQELESRWNAILGLEATIDGLRQRMENLRSQMEAESRKMLTADEKVHALNSDVAQWEKARSRVHYALPKVREFIHRATWALGLPERKKLEEIFKEHTQLPVSFPEIDKIAGQLEHLLKDRQVLSAHGVTVCQECQSIYADIQSALKRLQSNAAAKMREKMGEARKKGKFF